MDVFFSICMNAPCNYFSVDFFHLTSCIYFYTYIQESIRHALIKSAWKRAKHGVAPLHTHTYPHTIHTNLFSKQNRQRGVMVLEYYTAEGSLDPLTVTKRCHFSLVPGVSCCFHTVCMCLCECGVTSEPVTRLCSR